MDTKSFVNQLNQITDTLLSMTPAQREVIHLNSGNTGGNYYQ